MDIDKDKNRQELEDFYKFKEIYFKMMLLASMKDIIAQLDIDLGMLDFAPTLEDLENLSVYVESKFGKNFDKVKVKSYFDSNYPL